MIEKIQNYLKERKIYIDDLIQELDDAKSSEEILSVALKIKGRRSAAVEMFNDIYTMIKSDDNR